MILRRDLTVTTDSLWHWGMWTFPGGVATLWTPGRVRVVGVSTSYSPACPQMQTIAHADGGVEDEWEPLGLFLALFDNVPFPLRPFTILETDQQGQWRWQPPFGPALRTCFPLVTKQVIGHVFNYGMLVEGDDVAWHEHYGPEIPGDSVTLTFALEAI